MFISILKKQGWALGTISMLCLFSSYSFAHSIPLNEIAVKACDNKQRSDQCQYEGGHDDLYIGSCQYMSDSLMCVRNQPIQTITVNNKTSEETSHHTTENDVKPIE